ncbi:MAG: hypothetical protein K2P23_13335, partial [Lachnospiraceae bacterium]|nr:hypothetical protein [Lachnospiraceae bacterium]
AMMFLGDHWIGTEPFGKYFKDIGLDAVVGSVGDGVTLRMISDIQGVGYTEGRLLPYFFPDVFTEGGDPIGEAQDNWMKARRAILRSPLDRIGYGGYLKLASEWPGFIEQIQKVVDEFRQIHENMLGKNAKIYATYYTTRKDNEWAMQNPEEIQQEYLISDRVTAKSDRLRIALMKGFHTEQLKVNTLDNPKRWWEVIDRTTGEVVSPERWEYDEAAGEVVIETIPYHQYTVSFLAFLIWDPVHMYNFITNDWQDAPHQLTYDVRQPKTQAYVKEKLKRWCEENPHVDVVRFTTFFHQFTLTFDDKKREKFVEWFGYSASVSPYILEQFEKWAGYPFRPEYIVDQGYHNSIFRVPSKQFQDFIEFQQIEVCKLAKELVDIVHSYGKEAMMFLGDHWIGTEPFGKYFKDIGLD